MLKENLEPYIILFRSLATMVQPRGLNISALAELLFEKGYTLNNAEPFTYFGYNIIVSNADQYLIKRNLVKQYST